MSACKSPGDALPKVATSRVRLTNSTMTSRRAGKTPDTSLATFKFTSASMLRIRNAFNWAAVIRRQSLIQRNRQSVHHHSSSQAPSPGASTHAILAIPLISLFPSADSSNPEHQLRLSRRNAHTRRRFRRRHVDGETALPHRLFPGTLSHPSYCPQSKTCPMARLRGLGCPAPSSLPSARPHRAVTQASQPSPSSAAVTRQAP